MKYNLCIIDMQWVFEASLNKRTIQNCQREIKAAIKKNLPIFIVEFHGAGPTLKKLIGLCKNYKKLHFIKKYATDGSEEISQFINNKMLHSNFRVCGVNTDACVYYTVKGLTTNVDIPKIIVVADACNSSEDHKDGIKLLKKLPKVRVIRS